MIEINKDKLVITQMLGKISHPTLIVDRGYITTWDGKPKIGIGIGGIKYNVKVGDSCFGWPEAELLEPCVALVGMDKGSDSVNIAPIPSGVASGNASIPLYALSCVGNEVKVIDGEGKGTKGIVTGKTGSRLSHVLVHFPEKSLENLAIGDKVRVKAEGLGLEIEDFSGKIFNMSPTFLESLNVELKKGELTLPVVKEIPAYAMGSGVADGPAEIGHFCIQSCPPDLVKELGLENLKIGDLVALKDILMHYGNHYYRGALTVGIIAFGSSERAGYGPGVFAIATSKEGKIRPKIDPEANLVKYLGLKK